MFRRGLVLARALPLALACMAGVAGCHRTERDPATVVFLIESSPANLDPRIGTDAQSQHIDELLFDGLVAHDAAFHFTPALAASWEQTDPLTLVFHLRDGVRFHNGQPLTARDVAWTITSMRNGTIVSPRAAAFVSVDRVEARDRLTAVFHLKRPDNFLLTNLSTGAMGIVPEGAGKEFWRQPVGTGPFRFVSQQLDQDVVVASNPRSWQVVPSIARVRFAVVPDAITQSLELEKGSADVAVNSLPMDALAELAQRANLRVDRTAGTQIQYLAFNTADPVLRDERVRQAISCSIDRELILRTLRHGYGQLAVSLLPPTHWAWNGDVPRFDYDLGRARRLLDAAGLRAGPDGMRLRLTMKTSTDEETRLLAAVLQQQLAQSGIRLEIRSYEFATFYADVTRGAFQMYSLRWIGGNEQPDIYTLAFATSSIPPKGANRGRYSNAEVDRLLDDASQSGDQERRRADYAQVQRILATQLPSLPLWYRDTVVVHNRRLANVVASPSGTYAFLERAQLISESTH